MKKYIAPFIKGVLTSIAVVAIASTAAYVIVKHDSANAKVIEAVEPKVDYTLTAMTKIISRDGKLSTQTAEKYAFWVLESSNKHNVDPILVLSVMAVESTFKANAKNSGAVGLMQVVHYWHKEKSSKVALANPRINIDVGTRILKEYYSKKKTTFKTLVAYNGSENKIQYANKVLAYKAKYKQEILNEERNS